MNFQGLIVAVRSRTGVAATDATLNEAVIGDFVNQANALIATDADWPWRQVTTTFSTVAGTSSYTPPADWLRTAMLKVADFRPLTLVSPTQLEANWPFAATRGVPYEYAIYGDQLQVRPIPDGIYVVTHRYVKLEPVMAAPADLPLMPSQFHTAIVERAAWLAFRRLGYAAKAEEAKAAYDEWRALMMDDKRRTRAPLRPRTRVGIWP